MTSPIVTLPKRATGKLTRPYGERNRRWWKVKPRTEDIDRYAKFRLQLLSEENPTPEGMQRPRTRGECVDGPRPCPWEGCRFHLYLDVSRGGNLRLTRPDLEPHEMQESCALDAADRGGMTLDQVGAHLNCTRENVRLIELGIWKKLVRSKHPHPAVAVLREFYR